MLKNELPCCRFIFTPASGSTPKLMGNGVCKESKDSSKQKITLYGAVCHTAFVHQIITHCISFVEGPWISRPNLCLSKFLDSKVSIVLQTSHYYLFPVEGRSQGGADHGGETVQHATLAAVAAEEQPHLCR